MKKLLLKISSNPLAKNSMIVFAGTMIANVASYVYHLLLGRLLGPPGYGEISSLFSILYLFTVPLTVIQTVLVKYFSEFKARDEIGSARTLFMVLTKYICIGSAVFLPVIYIISPAVSSFLHLSSSGLFMTVYLLFVFSLLAIPPLSALQGYQIFFWSSLFIGGTIVVKVVLSIPFARWGVQGVLIAAIISAISVYVLYFIPLKFLIKSKGVAIGVNKKEAFAYIVPTLFTLLGLTSLYSTDIILVRHYLSAGEAGMYAAVAILGKIIFFASSAVALVSFPVLSEQYAKGVVSKKMIYSGILAVICMSVGLTGCYFVFPEFIVSMLFGNTYADAAALLGIFGMFISLYSVGYIISMICLAIGRTKVWAMPFFSALAQIALIVQFHLSVSQIVYINTLIAACMAVGAGIYLYGSTYEKI